VSNDVDGRPKSTASVRTLVMTNLPTRDATAKSVRGSARVAARIGDHGTRDEPSALQMQQRGRNKERVTWKAGTPRCLDGLRAAKRLVSPAVRGELSRDEERAAPASRQPPLAPTLSSSVAR